MEKQSYSYYLDSEFLPKVFEYSEDYGYQILCQDCKINTGEVSYNLSDLVTETPESNFILNTILTSAGILFLEKFVSWGQKKLNPTNPTKELK